MGYLSSRNSVSRRSLGMGRTESLHFTGPSTLKTAGGPSNPFFLFVALSLIQYFIILHPRHRASTLFESSESASSMSRRTALEASSGQTFF